MRTSLLEQINLCGRWLQIMETADTDYMRNLAVVQYEKEMKRLRMKRGMQE